MPAIRMTGMASGLPPNIVETIIDAEKIPIRTEQAKKDKVEVRLKLVQDLETKLLAVDKSIEELTGSGGFKNNKLTTGDNNIITGTAGADGVPMGNWNVEVIQLPQKASAISNGFPDKDTTEVGVGYLKFETSEGVKEVYIDGEHSTLEEMAREINKAQVGLTASVISDKSDIENPYRILISGLGTGKDDKVTFPTVYFLDGDQDFYFDQSKPAQNGKIKVDGVEIEVDDATVKDVIPGVTLQLKQASPGREITVSLKEDYELIVGKLDEFVKAANEVLSFIQSQNSLNEKTDTSKTLGGDSLLRTIENRFQNLIQNTLFGINGPIKRLGDLGIVFQRNGTLQYDRKKLDSLLNSNPKAVAAFLGGDGFTTGFIPTLRREISSMTNQVFGPLGNRKKGLQEKINNINKSIENKERSLAKKEDSLRRQFANLEEKMSKLQQQGAAVGAIGGGGGAAPKMGLG